MSDFYVLEHKAKSVELSQDQQINKLSGIMVVGLVCEIELRGFRSCNGKVIQRH